MKLQTLLRRIYKYKTYFLVNFTGLFLAFVSVFLIFAYVWNEFSYDRFHKNADRIVRITLNTNTGKSSLIDARVYGKLAPMLTDKYPEIEAYNRLMSWRKATVTIGEESFYDKHIYCVDSGFFDFFSFKLLAGDAHALLSKPKQLAISESMANTYFGTTDVIGKQVQLLYQRSMKPSTYTIKAVFADFPNNSHFKADFLCSYPDSKATFDWTYSYLLLSPGTDYKMLQSKIQQDMDSLNADREVKPIFNLQAITDIHYYSHKSRELKQNANIQSILLLISAALIILIIALINFTNLNYVQFLSNIKNNKIRIVNGASRNSIHLDFLKEISILIFVVIFLGLLSVNYLSVKYDFHSYEYLPLYLRYLFISLFIICILIFAYLPSLFWKERGTLIFTHKRIYTISLIVQLGLSIIAIIASIAIQRQIQLINKLHPQSKNSHIIVIPENTGAVVHKYNTFKEALLKHPEIIAVTATSEPPAGVVTDNFKFAYDNQKVDDHKTLNTLIIDTNFFSFLNIKPLAGTLSLNNTASPDWQQNALKLWRYKYMKRELPEGLKEKVEGYSDKFIVNKMALKVMGVENPQDAIGKSFELIHPMREFFPKGTIVGVVDNFHYTNMFIEEKPLLMVCRQIFCHNFLINFNQGNEKKALEILKSEWEKTYPDIPLQFEFISDSYQKVYQREYYEMKVLALFSLISIVLSLVGIFASLNFNLKLRTKEIGIRKVNGAKTIEIIYLFNLYLLKSFAIAFIISIPIAYYAVTKWLQNFAYQVDLRWWIFLLTGVIMLLIIIISVSLQTFYYARKNPVESLRYE